MRIAFLNNLLSGQFFLPPSIFFRVSFSLFIGTPVGQAIALMIKNIISTSPCAHFALFVGLINPSNRPCCVLITGNLHPDFGLCNPQIIALHDLAGIVAIFNRFAHLGDGAFQKTGIISRLGNREHPVPFGPELIAGLKLIPHLPGIRKIKKIALLCACIAGRLCWGTKHQEGQQDGI